MTSPDNPTSEEQATPDHTEAPASAEQTPPASTELEGETAAAETVPGTMGAAKKKRRRRRKKKSGEEDAKQVESHSPFGNLFKKTVRKHAFSTGEVIAGRVERVEDGAIVVDLFGKALAVVDVDEPREVPQPAAEKVEEAAASASTPQSQSADVKEETAPQETAPNEPTEAQTQTPAQGPTPTNTSDAATESAAVSAAPPAASESAEPAAAESDPDPALPEEPAAEKAQEEDFSDVDWSLLELAPSEQGAPEVGTIFRGRIGAISESGHIAIVNRIVDRPAVKKALRAARAEHKRVHGLVYGYNRGGFDVMVAGVRAFCPASGMALETIADPEPFIGKRLEFSLPQSKSTKRGVIVSRRNILEKEARKKARERMQELEVGQKLPGKVLEVREYGVLVDLGGGLDGLVHMSEVSWRRGVRPADVVTPGDEVEVQVLELQHASRKDRYGRVSLSLRACQPDPWDEQAEALTLGRPIKGRVVRTTDFGAFVEIAPGIEGLVHISELGRDLKHASQALEENQEIDIVIERVDKGQRRISLSRLSAADLQAIEAGEFDPSKAPRNLRPGTHVTVIVKRVDHNGLQVQVDGVIGKRGRGFIAHRDLAERRGKEKGPTQGSALEVKIIRVDRDGTLRCSAKARLQDDERKAVKEYRREAAKQGLGTFGDLLKAKLGGGD